ncbi:hypothetical protein HY772_06655 [Candidatus Woesearchaeota archaeon]|nr:hypothetical protein [Candidatus Woesearchaeota archaeon]
MIGGIALAIIVVFLVGFVFVGESQTGTGLAGEQAIVYKSQTCGCCDVYVGYLKNRGELNVEAIQTDDPVQVKKKFGIPSQLQSCHTTMIGGYFVEGHVPLEAVEKLLREKPDIAGIALPGMPSGAPGMLGGKEGPFVIYAVNKDGTYREFMKM